MSEPNRPVKEFRMGSVRISLWENRVEQDGMAVARHSATLNKRYRDKEGQWRDTTTLFADDLLRVAMLAQQAAVWMDVKERDPTEEARVA